MAGIRASSPSTWHLLPAFLFSSHPHPSSLDMDEGCLSSVLSVKLLLGTLEVQRGPFPSTGPAQVLSASLSPFLTAQERAGPC